MKYENEKIIDCNEFEDHLTDYLDNALNKQTRKEVATHALSCPLCHSLLNEVKDALKVCREIAVPKTPLTPLEARILSMTMPENTMVCREFEDYLTDYLDGFLPATLFHRWERHAVLCQHCTDLPGEVVRSIAACYTYKADELPLPICLHQKILQSTIGTENAKAMKASWTTQFGEWVRGLKIPISVPQLAPVAMMVLLAFFVFSGEGSFGNIYQKSFEIAEQTYIQGTEIWTGEINTNEGNQ